MNAIHEMGQELEQTRCELERWKARAKGMHMLLRRLLDESQSRLGDIRHALNGIRADDGLDELEDYREMEAIRQDDGDTQPEGGNSTTSLASPPPDEV